MKRTKWELAGIFAGIVGIFGVSMVVMPEVSAVEKSQETVTPFNASLLDELPSNRVVTLYINGTLIDDAGLAMLKKGEIPKVLPGPVGQMVDMALLAVENRAVTYSGVVQKADGTGSGGYTIVQSTRPETMAAYEQYNRQKFGGLMAVKKLSEDTFVSYLSDLPYEFNAAQKSDITVNPDDVFCIFNAKGKRQLTVRLVDGKYLLSFSVSVSSPEKDNIPVVLSNALNATGNQTEAVSAYIRQFVSVEPVGESEGTAKMRVTMVINDSLIELVKPILVQEQQLRHDGVPPEVATTSPINGTTGVDPATTAITITFDRPMNRTSYSFCRTSDKNFPETTAIPSYNAAGTVVTLPVKLKPDTTYDIYLNRGKLMGFFSTEGGGILKEYHYSFTTGSEK